MGLRSPVGQQQRDASCRLVAGCPGTAPIPVPSFRTWTAAPRTRALPPMDDPEAILFDLDDTIIDFSGSADDLWRVAFRTRTGV